MSDASPLTFTQGFMLGQISFLAIILLFMRYVVFSPADKGDEQGWKRRRQEREQVRADIQKAQAASKAPPTPAPGPAHVLAKAAYEMASHGAESTDWINVLFAQVMQGYRNDMLAGGGEEGAKLRVEKWLNPEGGRTTWLDPIEVTSMSLGTAYPLFSNARIRPADAQGRIERWFLADFERAEIDVDYNDAISLALSTSVLINFPRPRFAVLPVSLGVELISIGGTLSVQIHDPEEGRQHLHACLLPDFHLNLKTTTLLGSRAKLQDVPKLEQLILSRIRSAIQDRIVHPKHFSLSLPQLLSPRAASTTSASSGSTSTVINGVPVESKSTVTTAPATGVSSPTQAQFTAQQMIDDLGEEAVEAMSQAVKEGFGRMVHDLGLDGLGGGGADGERTNGSAGANGARLQNGSAGVHPASANAQAQSAAAAAASTRGRRIPMPAGFPYSRASSTVEPTPLPTPGLNIPGGLSMSGSGSGAGSGAGVSRMLSSVHAPSLVASHRSSLVNGNGTAGATTAYRPLPSTAAGSSNEEDRFRFRGQFAGPASGAGHDGMANGTEPRRMGVLNSRA